MYSQPSKRLFQDVSKTSDQSEPKVPCTDSTGSQGKFCGHISDHQVKGFQIQYHAVNVYCTVSKIPSSVHLSYMVLGQAKDPNCTPHSALPTSLFTHTLALNSYSIVKVTLLTRYQPIRFRFIQESYLFK